MYKLTIDRNTWLRGEGGDDSFLLREVDGKQCCLGFLGFACGATRKQLIGARTPSVSRVLDIFNKDLGKFLFVSDHWNEFSKDAEELMYINDRLPEYFSSETEREKQLTEIFARNGIEIEFVN
jgi:hypothetical protein